MRIPERHRENAVSLLRQRFGKNAHIWLFGSRVNDARRGGDIDIYVEAEAIPISGKAKAKLYAGVALESLFDGASVDLLVRFPDESEQPIHRIAKETGSPL
jgi:predicted nucleotidyltransferase